MICCLDIGLDVGSPKDCLNWRDHDPLRDDVKYLPRHMVSLCRYIYIYTSQVFEQSQFIKPHTPNNNSYNSYNSYNSQTQQSPSLYTQKDTCHINTHLLLPSHLFEAPNNVHPNIWHRHHRRRPLRPHPRPRPPSPKHPLHPL